MSIVKRSCISNLCVLGLMKLGCSCMLEAAMLKVVAAALAHSPRCAELCTLLLRVRRQTHPTKAPACRGFHTYPEGKHAHLDRMLPWFPQGLDLS